MKKLFVYGTLKRGFKNNFVLNPEDFVETTMTKNKYLMIDLGHFPALLEVSDLSLCSQISGELYYVDDCTFIDVDIIEGYPILFTRKEIDLQNGEKANAYFMSKEIANLSQHIIVEDGEWN